jgi:hypothetical protein
MHIIQGLLTLKVNSWHPRYVTKHKEYSNLALSDVMTIPETYQSTVIRGWAFTVEILHY